METMKVGYETSLNEYIQQERTAVKLTNSIGHLMFDKGVELVFFRNHMVDISISELLNLFEYAKNVVEKPLEIDLVNDIVEELYKMDLAPSKIDIGKLSNEYLEQASILYIRYVFLIHRGAISCSFLLAILSKLIRDMKIDAVYIFPI